MGWPNSNLWPGTKIWARLWSQLPTRIESELTDSTMKTAGAFLVAALLMVCGSVRAQTRYGTVFLNNYDSGKGLFDILCGVPARVGTMVEVLGGPNRNSVLPIATAIGVSRYTIVARDLDVNGPNSGSFFDYGFGEVRGVLPGATATFELRQWYGASQ